MSSVRLFAQTSEKEIPIEFFRIFKTEPMKAMDYAFSTNIWMERNIGNNLKLISYMLRYDRQPMRFTFVLYKPKNKWQVQNLNWDVDLDDEIEESANQNRN